MRQLELPRPRRQQFGELVAVGGPHDGFGVLVQASHDVRLVQQEIHIGRWRLRIVGIGHVVGGQRMPGQQSLGIARGQALQCTLAVEHQPHRDRIVAGDLELGDVALEYAGVSWIGLDRTTNEALSLAGDQHEAFDIDDAAAQCILAQAQRFIAPRKWCQPQMQGMPTGLLPGVLRLQMLWTEEGALPPMNLPLSTHPRHSRNSS